jgi:5-formyltetrahydrofolate cyclo-ligase
VAVEKKELREILRGCRGSLPAREVAERSITIERRLLASAAYRAAHTIVLYAAKDHEVATDLIFAEAIVSDRRVLFPRVVCGTRSLALARVRSLKELQGGAYGLLEPTGAETVPLAALGAALVCVPGLGFTREGLRLGRGGGYYDRFLAATEGSTTTVGLAFAFQVLDRIPQSPSDRRLNSIVSEFALYTAVPTAPARAAQGGLTCS